MDGKKMEHFSQIEIQVQIGSLRQIELLSKESSLQLMNDENYKYIYSFPYALAFQIVCSNERGKIYALLSALSPFLLLKIIPF